MKLEVRFIGRTIVELNINSSGSFLEEDIADLHGLVDLEFISDLKQIVDELESHNNEIELREGTNKSKPTP